MGKYKTEQENFWAGEFGNEYINRNDHANLLASNRKFFADIISNTKNVKSIIEFGANIGLNLRAVKDLLPEVKLSAVEINEKAVDELKNIKDTHVFHESILQFEPAEQHDMAFTKGVLIHINPDQLVNVYDVLYNSSKRYICVAEYYNPTPVELTYRGHDKKLFKRDFAGELLDRYKDLELVNYGFVYQRDNQFPQDDITWFLLEKNVGKGL